MTDRRATDLSYGHLGESSYDINEGHWGFSIKDLRNQTFQQLLPLTLCQSPSTRKVPEPKQKPANLLRSQLKYLVKNRPETYPANTIASALSRIHSDSQANAPPTTAQLFSVGGAVDVERQPGYRTIPIIAIPCGAAGHVLRLIRPRIESYGWGKPSPYRLSLLDAAAAPDHGHWAGTGGTIRHICFSDDVNATSTWLAIRQALATTIFRPMYHSSPTPAITPVGYGTKYPPSRLGANPVAVLTAERTGSRQHVDVTFNPYYARQFAVVDDTGSWTIWDIEGRIRKRSALELIPGKSGHIYDGYMYDSTLKKPDSVDGWHRLLWVSNVSTIVLCNRRHIAVFDIKSTPTRLQCAEILGANSTDWILDVKRSVVNLSHLFVLTSSRVFWVEITAPEEDKEGQHGSRIILSHRHFRDPNDTTMSLTVLSGDDVSVLISSAKSLLANFYSFSMNGNGVGGPTSSRGSFSILASLDHQATKGCEEQPSIYFLQATLIPNLPQLPRPQIDYVSQNVKFYQVWILSPDLSLKSTLFSVYSTEDPGSLVGAPNWKFPRGKTHRPGSQHALDDTFVIPNGDLNEEGPEDIPGSDPLPSYQSSLTRTRTSTREQNDAYLKINWSSIFQRSFVEESFDSTGYPETPIPVKTMEELLRNIFNRINDGKRINNLPMSSFLELSQPLGFSEELEQAAPMLKDFLEGLQQGQDPDAPKGLVISNLSSCLGIDFPAGEKNSFPDLLQIYDRVGEYWLASLPLKVSNLGRLSKFRIACKIAVELCMGSIAVSLCSKPSHVLEEQHDPDMGELSLPILNKAREFSREESLPLLSSQDIQDPSQNPSLSHPTPTRTPSLYSHGSATSAEQIEDTAITRLRQYVVSIQPLSGMGTSALLSHWPSLPGQDPTQYKWETLQKPSIEDHDEERHNNRKRREEARRRRKTESLLNRERIPAPEISSQPAFMPFGSHPEFAQNQASSQALDEMPMTQPDRGLFGSRTAQVGKKKPKKRRAAGF